MYYAPHRLQVKVVEPLTRDEYGQPIPGTGGESWKDVCRCRCDDNTTNEFTSENGSAYRPSYHVVCEMKVNLQSGDYCRCLNGDIVRGEGKIYIPKWLNFLDYSELWM